MAGIRLASWAAFVAVLLSAGCCSFCEKHCPQCHPQTNYQPCCAPVCCQPTNCCAPAPTCPPGCAPVAAGYPASSWARPAGQPGGCN
jgi:hypothetical protein